SVATSADLRAGGLDVDRLYLVPLGHVPIDVDSEQRAAVRERFGLSEPFVLATGTLEPRKYIPPLIDAFNSVARGREVRLVLAGPEGWGASAEQLLAPLDPSIRERVVVTGEVPKAELAALYSEAAAFCYPSLLEGFGLPVLEAMSYGAPVVTSQGTATEEVAGDAAIMIDPRSSADLGAALCRVLDDGDLAGRLVEAGLQRSRDFSWDSVGQATVDVYSSLS
ncbi:MAG: glycosyltransferase family 1 protein, partial [Actinomycetota bacterium]|nr:glycosyltransferase family 1 protein [Actinomycetota bacterium]